jgi:hypothetical protein
MGQSLPKGSVRRENKDAIWGRRNSLRFNGFGLLVSLDQLV